MARRNSRLTALVRCAKRVKERPEVGVSGRDLLRLGTFASQAGTTSAGSGCSGRWPDAFSSPLAGTCTCVGDVAGSWRQLEANVLPRRRTANAASPVTTGASNDGSGTGDTGNGAPLGAQRRRRIARQRDEHVEETVDTSASSRCSRRGWRPRSYDCPEQAMATPASWGNSRRP